MRYIWNPLPRSQTTKTPPAWSQLCGNPLLHHCFNFMGNDYLFQNIIPMLEGSRAISCISENRRKHGFPASRNKGFLQMNADTTFVHFGTVSCKPAPHLPAEEWSRYPSQAAETWARIVNRIPCHSAQLLLHCYHDTLRAFWWGWMVIDVYTCINQYLRNLCGIWTGFSRFRPDVTFYLICEADQKLHICTYA